MLNTAMTAVLPVVGHDQLHYSLKAASLFWGQLQVRRDLKWVRNCHQDAM